MKSLYIKALALSGLLSPAAFGLSLYDTAPPIGLPESYAVRYSASVNFGYDDNLNSSSRNKEGGAFAGFNLGASYSDQDSITRMGYNLSLGGRIYSDEAANTNQNLFSESSLRASLSHSFGAGSVYSAHLSLSYKPEPDYGNGISASRARGECLNWAFNNSYSRSIDSRWSWNVNASYSGNIYSQSEYQTDNREYLSGGAGLVYRASTLTSYNLSVSGSYDFRDYGYNSQNIHTTLGISHALTPVSSMSASVGAQLKFIDGETNLYPTLRLGYNRRLSEGLSVSSYVSFYNENVDTYRGTYRGRSVNYLSDMACRVGADMNYVLSPKVSFQFGASLLSSRYSKGQGIGDTNETTWTAHVGMSYRLSERVSTSLRYNYTDANKAAWDYTRNVVTASCSYAF